MLYGSIFMLLYCIVKGEKIIIDWSITYIAPTLYLGIMGSFIAFWSYLTLINRIGPGRAAYVLVATPILALCISSLFEGYIWSIATFAGMTLVVIGNILVLKR
jgi:drug/metabolite transporter (DMT)-like permease